MDPEVQNTINESEIVVMMRSSSSESRIDPEFKQQLGKNLRKSLSPSSGFFLKYKMFLSAFAVLLIAVPVLLLVFSHNNKPSMNLDQTESEQAAAELVNKIRSSDFNELKTEFGNAINARAYDELDQLLAETVLFKLWNTECCGEIPKSEAKEELVFQLSDVEQFDFSELSDEVAQLKQTHTEFSNKKVGVNDTLVLAFSFSSNFLVDSIIIGNKDQLIDVDIVKAVAAFKERLNARDYVALEQSLSEFVIFTEDGSGCCGAVEREDAISRLKNFKAQSGDFNFSSSNNLEKIQNSHPYLENYILGVSNNGNFVGFSINSDLKIDKIFTGLNPEEGITAGNECHENRTVAVYQSQQRNAIEVDISLTKKPQVLWDQQFASTVSDVSDPIFFEGRIYFTTDGRVYGINASSGKTEWVFETISGTNYSAPVISEYTIYFNNDNFLYAVDLESGQLLWKNRLTPDSVPVAVPVASCNHIVYITASNNGSKFWLVGVNRLNGRTAWTFELGGDSYSVPVYSDGKIYLSDRSRNVYAINADDGKLVWRNFIGFRGGIALSLSDNRLFVAASESDKSIVYIINPETGNIDWSIQLEGIIVNNLVADENNLYVAVHSGEISAYDLESHQQIWKQTLTALPRGMLSTAGELLVASDKGNLITFKNDTGIILWEYLLVNDGSGRTTIPVVTGKGITLVYEGNRAISLK